MLPTLQLDIDKIRQDTQHCTSKIFMNSAGASLVPTIVNQRIKTYLDEEEYYGGYKLAFSDIIQSEIQEFYAEAAKMLNTKVRNIAFMANATDAFAQALNAIVFDKNDTIITTDDDYISNHVTFSRLSDRYGVNILRMKNMEDGELDIEDLEILIKIHHPKLISVTHIPTNTGKIQNVKAVGQLCKQYDILYIVDACQSAGQLPINVDGIACDFLCASGRKFLRGPRGTGFLYVSDKALTLDLTPMRMDGRGAEWISDSKFKPYDSAIRFETWEQSIANILGLKEAVKYGNDLGFDNIFAYNQSLLHRLRSILQKIEGIRLLDNGLNLSNICTFVDNRIDKQKLIDLLDRNNVYYSVAFRGSALIDFDKKGTDWAIRLSPHYFNTIDEIDMLGDILKNL